LERLQSQTSLSRQPPWTCRAAPSGSPAAAPASPGPRFAKRAHGMA